MDIDLLSSRWQQHTPAPSATTRPAPLAGPPPSPLAQMRRNVRIEIWTTLTMGILLLLGLYSLRSTHLGRLLTLLLPLYGGIGYCYYRLVRVLRHLRDTSGPLAGHVAGQLRQLRQLMQLYYGSTMLSTLAVLGVLGYLAITYLLPHVPPTGQVRFLTWLLLTAAISAGVTHWFCRYHIHNFYGQHLDRLEAVLHELHKE